MQANVTSYDICTVIRTRQPENLTYGHNLTSVHHTNILLSWSS